MTTRGWIFAAVALFAGLVIGVAVFHAYIQNRENLSAELFARKLRCSELANAHAKRETNDDQLVSVQRAGYSAALNSCVGYFWEHQQFKTYTYRQWDVIDLLSNETYYYDNCGHPGNCGNGNDSKINEKAELAFKRAITGEPEVSKKAK